MLVDPVALPAILVQMVLEQPPVRIVGTDIVGTVLVAGIGY
jgi:hypothetical protein